MRFFLLLVVFSTVSSQSIGEIDHVLESKDEIIAFRRILDLINKYSPEFLNAEELKVINDEITADQLPKNSSVPSTSNAPMSIAKASQFVNMMEKKMGELTDETKVFLLVVKYKLERIVDGIELTTADDLIAVLNEISNVAELHFSSIYKKVQSVQSELKTNFPFFFHMFEIRKEILVLLGEHKENVNYFLEHIDFHCLVLTAQQLIDFFDRL
ncbi:hypothetical protein PFISCL1PPCAC_1420 [Pristionchus fissidentatus]|uniref:Uncharacterized protein n=1 Tax=Pristionchus fissidentatus TaxID=1538716 RepID=A0AAV5UVE9_9BILA|nr:hypothetical protein PFISCL1PPCAC_1420 [Pristionchus fissidentatus]